MVRDLGDALDHAHAQGVVHRDVKPGNVLIRKDGLTKLADLGIATASDGTQITRSGTVLGTAAYMAPEQLDGRGAGPPADIYALAAIAFEALSGKRRARAARRWRSPTRSPPRAPPTCATPGRGAPKRGRAGAAARDGAATRRTARHRPESWPASWPPRSRRAPEQTTARPPPAPRAEALGGRGGAGARRGRGARQAPAPPRPSREAPPTAPDTATSTPPSTPPPTWPPTGPPATRTAPLARAAVA